MSTGERFDSAEAARAAEATAERQDVARWTSRLQRVVRDMPDGIWIYVSEGHINVMASSEGGDFMTKSGGVDPEAVVASVPCGSRWGGGGW